jgi:hypothetical protein
LAGCAGKLIVFMAAISRGYLPEGFSFQLVALWIKGLAPRKTGGLHFCSIAGRLTAIFNGLE